MPSLPTREREFYLRNGPFSDKLHNEGLRADGPGPTWPRVFPPIPEAGARKHQFPFQNPKAAAPAQLLPA